MQTHTRSCLCLYISVCVCIYAKGWPNRPWPVVLYITAIINRAWLCEFIFRSSSNSSQNQQQQQQQQKLNTLHKNWCSAVQSRLKDIVYISVARILSKEKRWMICRKQKPDLTEGKKADLAALLHVQRLQQVAALSIYLHTWVHLHVLLIHAVRIFLVFILTSMCRQLNYR